MLVCYIMRRKWSHARDLRPALPITNRLHRCLCLRGKKPSPRRDSHPHLSDFKSDASSVGLHGERWRKAEDMLPRPVSRSDLISNESRLTRPVHLPRWSPRKELHPDDEVRSLACCLLHHAERNGAPPRTRTG